MNGKELLPFLFFVGVLLFNWPFLDIFSMSLPGYLFIAWGLFVIVIGILTLQTPRQNNNKDV